MARSPSVSNTGGTRRKPIEEKKRLGNLGKRPLPDETNSQTLDRVDPATKPLAPLLKRGKTAWHRTLRECQWIGESDLFMLQHMCELTDEHARLRREVMKIGSDLAARRQLRLLGKELLTSLDQLGLSPTARARLGVAEVRIGQAVAELEATQLSSKKPDVVDADSVEVPNTDTPF